MTFDEQIETFLRHHTFPCSNRKAARAELLRIIDEAVKTALVQDLMRRIEAEMPIAVAQNVTHRRAPALASLARSNPDSDCDGRPEISYNFGYGPGG